MVRSHVLRALRLPLLLLALLALLWLGLAAAVGTNSHQPLSLHARTTSSGSGTDFGNNGGNPDKHCKDGHGQDDTHNKHCRGISHD